MRRPTLDEKRYGPGFRPYPMHHIVRTFNVCAVDGCADPVYGVVTLYVDDHPPAMDWYTRLLRTLPIGADTDVGLCTGHAREVIVRDEEFMMDPDLWAPGRENPPVLPSPMRVNPST